MKRHAILLAMLGALPSLFPHAPRGVEPALLAQSIRVTRLAQNPLITVDSSPTLGGNVNGPTVIRVPDWIERSLGR